MAGLKNNTITYVFEGDTLNLEQAIKRVQSLMRGTVKTLKEQEGGMSEIQKDQYKQLRSLMKTIKLLNEKRISQILCSLSDNLLSVVTFKLNT